MDADSQNRGHCSGCIAGVPNYQNDILVDIVEKELPLGHEAWRAVAFAYQNASNEENLWWGEDIWDNWVKKLCNNFK